MAILVAGAFALPGVASAQEAFIKTFGSSGSGAGQVDDPIGTSAIDSAGDLFLPDEDNNRIDEFSPTGAFVMAFGWGVKDGASQLETCTTSCQAGISGGGAGEMTLPSGVAISPSGDLYVSEYAGFRIDEFTLSGGFIRSFGTAGYGAGEMYFPIGIAVDSAGDVFDDEGARIDEFTATGGFVQSFGWGVVDGQSRFEDCTTTTGCRAGVGGGGAGQLLGNGEFPRGMVVVGDDLFVTDNQNARIDEFTTSGGFVRDWGWGVADGQSKFETCTTTCQAGIQGWGAGQMTTPSDIALGPAGTLYVSDLGGGNTTTSYATTGRIEEFTTSGSFIESFGWGVADGQSKLETCNTSCQKGPKQAGQALPYAPESLAVGASGDVLDVESADIDEFLALPASTAAPSITGTPQPGDSLSCSPGSWSGSPTSFAYQWDRDGEPIAGATGRSYVVQIADEADTLTCAVAASNAGGAGAPAVSAGVFVGVKSELSCKKASGSLSGTRLGPLALGLTLAQAKKKLPVSAKNVSGFTSLCLYAGFGIRVAFPSAKELRALKASERARVKNRIVIALTANPRYKLKGVIPGEKIAAVEKKLHAEKPFHIGINFWYFCPNGSSTGVLKVRDGIIYEVGIATKALSDGSYKSQFKFMNSFG